jgi:hypothetical protein
MSIQRVQQSSFEEIAGIMSELIGPDVASVVMKIYDPRELFYRILREDILRLTDTEDCPLGITYYDVSTINSPGQAIKLQIYCERLTEHKQVILTGGDALAFMSKFNIPEHSDDFWFAVEDGVLDFGTLG